ncbi:MAG TPA: ABC transporter ATP-binding protein [Nitrospira sp.]|nr:ABC transporter ATP-binding protein [Nitrospira sp.]
MNSTSKIVIQTVSLTREYAMGSTTVHALRGVDLSVGAGEFLALMGASGSGKSTLLNMIGLLDRPTSGQYRLEDLEVFSLSRDDLATIRGRRIGFIFQNFNLLPRYSTWENVALPLAYRKGEVGSDAQYKRAMQMLARVGLGGRAGHQPMELSGGERQRVAIARALVTEPAVLLADEPTGNLDSATGKEIMSLLTELHAEGKTIIMVTHDMNIARYASRICTMRDGILMEGESTNVAG